MKKIIPLVFSLSFLFSCGKKSGEDKTMKEPSVETQTLILKYAREGDYANLVKIVTDGVSVNFKGPDGDTPLLAALGPRASSKDKELMLPVDKEVIRLLISTIDDSRFYMNPLGRPGPTLGKAISLYLKYQFKDKDKDTAKAFIKKAVEDRENTVRFLLGKGADINVTDADGNTPAQRAAANGHTDLIPWLTQTETLLEIKYGVYGGMSPIRERSITITPEQIIYKINDTEFKEPTSKVLWNKILSKFNAKEFASVESGPSRQAIDGADTMFHAKTNRRDMSFRNSTIRSLEEILSTEKSKFEKRLAEERK